MTSSGYYRGGDGVWVETRPPHATPVEFLERERELCKARIAKSARAGWDDEPEKERLECIRYLLQKARRAAKA